MMEFLDGKLINEKIQGNWLWSADLSEEAFEQGMDSYDIEIFGFHTHFFGAKIFNQKLHVKIFVSTIFKVYDSLLSLQQIFNYCMLMRQFHRNFKIL